MSVPGHRQLSAQMAVDPTTGLAQYLLMSEVACQILPPLPDDEPTAAPVTLQPSHPLHISPLPLCFLFLLLSKEVSRWTKRALLTNLLLR